MTSKPLNEFDLIARYLAPLATHLGARGLTDDVATLSAEGLGAGLVLTADAIVAGVHFFPGDPPDTVAERVLRVNLSDLAAKGAKPIGYLLTLALPPTADEAWIADFTAGLARNQAAFDWSLLGGDTVSTPGPLTISVAALGEAPAAGAPVRSGASAGDDIWVSGTIGDGALGLALSSGEGPTIAAGLSAQALNRFRQPQPRLNLGRAAIDAGLVTASADVSDGLVADIGHIADASHLRALINAADVPLSDAGQAAVTADAEWLPKLLSGGDDYELVLTAGPADAQRMEAAAASAGVALTKIGQMENGSGVSIRRADGGNLVFEKAGYRHF